MAQKVPELSLFLPIYNEEAAIAKVIKSANQVLKKVADQYEILCIEDGSQDSSAQVIRKLAKTNKNLRMIQHQPNRGYGGAFKSGLYGSQYNLVSYIDADGQFDYSEITKFLESIKKADLVLGFRLNRQEGKRRQAMAFLWRLWNFALFGLWVKDPDCGFKLIKKQVIDAIPQLVTESAETEAEFLIRAQRLGFTFSQIGVHHYPRQGGKSTGDNFKVIFKAVKETLHLWYVLNLQ